MAYLRSVFRSTSIGGSGSSSSNSATNSGSAGANSTSNTSNNNNNNNNNNEDEDEEMSSSGAPVRSPGVVVLSGFLKKQKSMKKKFFALKAEAPGFQVCLEYYDSKKKFESNQPPKRSINVSKCHSIERRHDNKHKHVLCLLYAKNERFNILMESEKELNRWYDAIQLLQTGTTFEHTWLVNIHKRGLGTRHNLNGPHRLHLTDRMLTLVKSEDESRLEPIDIALTMVRRAGCVDQFFYIEVGRSSSVGDGEIWMEVEDSNIAQNVYYTINNAMIHLAPLKVKSEDDGPKPRLRSSSANEASKPISVLQRRYTTQKLHGVSPLEEQRIHEEQLDPLKDKSVTASAPLQSTQLQTTSTSNTQMASSSSNSSGGGPVAATSTATTTLASSLNHRRHSVASHSSTPSPTANNSHVSQQQSATTSSSSTTGTTATPPAVSHQRTLSLPLATCAINQTQSSSSSSKRSVLRCVSSTGRDRCDSLPSRARTTSESYPSSSVSLITSTAGDGQHQQYTSSSRLAHHLRPHSMHHHHQQQQSQLRGPTGMSYSPPVSSMPISPASGACSTDSAGSSFSMDDGSENTEEGALSKYGHSLTPDEPVILEENGDEYVPWSASGHQKFSPNFKSCSPSQSSYVDMYSPCGSSPGRSGYMPMSPATTGMHSRTSSLVEEGTTLPDGYVPMAPLGDDGYVDMDPVSNASHNGHFVDDMSQHGGSSCSVTSGTPSTDMRFIDFHLDRVSSFLTSADEQQARPTRAYSVGSRPEQAAKYRKNKLEIQQEMSRVRAFSVGSRSKKPEIMNRLANVVIAPLVPGSKVQSSKSNSAPMLSGSWSHNSVVATSTASKNDHMEDLMELDFSKPSPPVNFVAPPPPPPTSYSQTKSVYSTAATTNDTSSYVDMSPGQLPISTTAPYVDMNGPNKINRNNFNNNSISNINNNNTTTANNNHGHSLILSHPKPVITQIASALKPVEEQESPYLPMDRGSLEDWSNTGISPKQMPSPCQEDYMQMNGPPGSVRTAPMDLPQPRQPPEGYVEMSFKPKQSASILEQDYTNMSLGSSNINQRRDSGGSNRTKPHLNNNRKKKSSLPIAIQTSTKSYKTPNYLPLSDSPTSESQTSTPASPPRATPTGSTATIFPFSLNSPQSPIKSFTVPTTASLVKQPLSVITNDPPKSSYSRATAASSAKGDVDTPVLIMTSRKISAQSPVPGVDGCPSFKKAHDAPPDNPTATTAPPLLTEKRVVTTEKLGKPAPININPSTISKEPLRHKTISVTMVQDPAHPISPITKKLSDLTVSKSPRLMNASPTTSIPTSPTPTAFKPVQPQQPSTSKPASPKVIEDTTPTPTLTPTSTPTPTPTPTSPVDSSEGYEKLQPGATTGAVANLLDSKGYEKLQPGAVTAAPSLVVPTTPNNNSIDSGGYEKLQPGATLLHYASLELPEATGIPPVSPTPIQEGFNYVEIDFAKSKQN